MKQTIRAFTLAKRDALSKDELLQHSADIYEKLLPYLQGSVGLYSAIGSEVNITTLRCFSSITCAFPKTYPNHTIRFFEVRGEDVMMKGSFGILEPKEQQEQAVLDVLVVPLVAFDEHCNRLGHGKGFYDRYLQAFKGLTIGVAHECQKVNCVYEEAHDVPLDMIITEAHIYKKSV